ncbi:MAG: 23S rRNA (pseudouridine(1915)-N(3))-methyltransferase RlmH [Acutalibacteraceae bacterium]
MIEVRILCLGRLKEPYLRSAAAEYQKRLTAFCKLTIIEKTPARLPSSPSQAEIDAALHQEAKTILAEIPSGAYVYALCIEGKQRSSEQFSRELAQLGVAGHSSVVFVIGSSYGLADEVKQRADAKLSMSQMTFPHQLARIMLLEQVYRAFMIDRGGKYHK